MGINSRTPLPPPRAFVASFKTCPHVYGLVQENIWDEWGWEGRHLLWGMWTENLPSYKNSPKPHFHISSHAPLDDHVLKAQKGTEPYDVTGRIQAPPVIQAGLDYDGRH